MSPAPLDIARRRLHSQRITGPPFDTPDGVVRWLVAVQAQDYTGAKWAIGSRLADGADEDVEKAFADGRILRTHVLRPTWHFVTPDDIRWLLALTGPRVQALNAHMYRKLGLDRPAFKRSHAAIVKALRDGRQLTREELRAAIERAGVVAGDRMRLAYLVMQAELDAVICSGARRGKQFTYALFDDRVPRAKAFDRDESLAELAVRFFRSRGPATVHDLAKWSGLTVADAKRGLDAAGSRLRQEAMGDRTLWCAPSRTRRFTTVPRAHVMSIYDEYISGYRDRRDMMRPADGARLIALGAALAHVIVIDGQIVGRWSRRITARDLTIETDVFIKLTKAARRTVIDAANRYGRFLGRRTIVTEAGRASRRTRRT